MREKVSIIIPYFRKIEYIQDTLNSLYSQSYKNFEIIIVYDDPIKSDLKILKNKISNKKIKLLINKKNLGAGLSRNKAAKNAKGKFLAFIDADDLWHKDKLKNQLKFMKEKNISCSFTSYSIVNMKNQTIGKIKAKSKLTYDDLIKSCDIGLSTVIIKKKIFKKFQFSNNKTKEDYSLWLKLSKETSIYGYYQNLTKWRKLSNSLSSNTTQKLFDAFHIYYFQENQNFIKSLISVFLLSLNYLNKNFRSRKKYV